MREEDDPRVADEGVEVDGAGGGFGLEVGRCAAEAETMRDLLSVYAQSRFQCRCFAIFLEGRGKATHGAGRSSEDILSPFVVIFMERVEVDGD